MSIDRLVVLIVCFTAACLFFLESSEALGLLPSEAAKKKSEAAHPADRRTKHIVASSHVFQW